MSFDAHGSVQGSSAPAPSPTPAAPAAPAAPAPAAAPAQPEPSQSPAPSEQSGDQTPAEFKTDFKFKVLDQEHTVDDFLHGAIKDEKSWNRVKELYEKSMGLDVIKPKFQETRQALEHTRGELESLHSQISDLRKVYSAGDLDSFFEKLKIPQQRVLEWVLEKAQLEEMDPAQRRVFDERRQLKLQNLQLADQQERYQTQLQEQESKAMGFMLNVELEKQDVRSFAEKFDARAGKPGAFREAVIEYGEHAYYATQGRVVLSPEQAVAKTLERYKVFLSDAPQQLPESVPAAPAQSKKPAHLPNLASKPSAAAAGLAKPKSIDDLKKLHREMIGQ